MWTSCCLSSEPFDGSAEVTELGDEAALAQLT